MTTGECIRQAREKAHLTQAELARKLGVPYQSISQWERNIRKPKIQTLAKLSEALEVDIAALFGDDENSYVGYSSGTITKAQQVIFQANSALSGSPLFSEDEVAILAMFRLLNAEGQKKALERVGELAEISRYKKDPLLTDK